MEEILYELVGILVSGGLFGFAGYCTWNACKIFTIIMVCRHPELSDEKVKYLTCMISKNKH